MIIEMEDNSLANKHKRLQRRMIVLLVIVPLLVVLLWALFCFCLVLMDIQSH